MNFISLLFRHFLPDHFYDYPYINIFPYFIGSDCGGLGLKGKRQAGAVT